MKKAKKCSSTDGVKAKSKNMSKQAVKKNPMGKKPK